MSHEKAITGLQDTNDPHLSIKGKHVHTAVFTQDGCQNSIKTGLTGSLFLKRTEPQVIQNHIFHKRITLPLRNLRIYGDRKISESGICYRETRSLSLKPMHVLRTLFTIHEQRVYGAITILKYGRESWFHTENTLKPYVSRL